MPNSVFMGKVVWPYRKVSAASAPITLVSDTFTDTNGTALTAHTPDIDGVGDGWTSNVLSGTGSIQIQSNKADVIADSGTFVANGLIETNKANVTIDFDMTMANNAAFGSQGCQFRYVDSSNWWFARRKGSGGDFQLVENDAGVTTERDISAAGIAHNTTVAIQVVTDGDSIAATVDGANDLSFSSSLHGNATIHGFQGADNDTIAGTKVDNLSIVG